MPHDREDSPVGIPTGLDRRDFLRLGGAAVATTALASPSASASTTRYDITFSDVVDVTDYGADPTGTERSDRAIEDAIGEDTLLVFPPGDYLIADTLVWSGLDCYGFYGDGDVRFVPPSGSNELILNARGDEILFEGIDIDHREQDTVSGLLLKADTRLAVEDVTYLGRGTHPDDSVTYALKAEVTQPDGTGLVRNVRAEKGSAIGHYKAGNGRIGIYSGPGHEGRLRFENVHLEEFANNALYVSKNPGSTEVIDSYFRNNNIASIRLSGDGSYVENCQIELDLDEYTGPTDGLDSKVYMRGIWAQQGRFDFPGGVRINNSEISIADSIDAAVGIIASDDAKTLDVMNTTIRVDADGERAIQRKSPDHSNGTVTLDNVSVVGDAQDQEAIFIAGTDGSTVRNSCIYTPGSGRDGILFRDATNALVDDTNISVSGDGVVEDGTAVTTSGITADDSCPLPGVSDPEDSPDHTITIESVGSQDWTTYEFTVSGALEKGTDANGGDSVDGSTASGGVAGGGSDNYLFDGEVSSFTVTEGELDNIQVFVDGAEYELGDGYDHTAEIESVGSEDYVGYELTVSGALEKGRKAGGSDSVDGSTASGGVAGGGSDNYLFDGEVSSFTVTEGELDNIQVFVDGAEYELGDGYDHTAEIESVGSEDYVGYELTVSGALEKGRKAGGSDSVDGSTASGGLAGGGSDTYLFDGTVEGFTITKGTSDDVALYVDGEEVAVGDEKTVRVRSVGSKDYVGYEFDVSGSVEKGTDANSGDSVDGSTANGAVAGGGRDSYQITGEVTDVRVTDGDMDDVDVSVDGSDIPVVETVEIHSVGSEDYVGYEFTVDGALEKGRKAGGSDTVSGSTATGGVAAGGTDSYRMAGSVSGFTVNNGSADDVALYVDGDRLY